MAELPDREKVIADLSELPDFRPAILAAWERWRKRDPRELLDLNDSARAMMVHCFIVAEAAKRLAGRAQRHDKAGLVVFAIRDYSIRFKKLDAQLVSRNQETEQVKAYMQQRQLDGIPTLWNLEVGYVLDKIGIEVASTNLVCPNGYKNEPYWHIELHDEGYQLGEIQDLFAPENQPDDSEPLRAQWKRRDSGVIIPFNRKSKSDD